MNELAVANSQGLLEYEVSFLFEETLLRFILTCYLTPSDDEYRLLRQNLFERLASGSSVPTETPIVPVSTVTRENGDLQSEYRAARMLYC